MLQKIRQVFQKSVKPLKNTGGQVAVIIILILAMALIFYAVSMNLGKIAQTKTMVTIASNSGASYLASQMASYGQQLFMVTLGGKKERCGVNAVFMAIIGFILAIAAIIFTGGTALTILSAVLALGSIGLQNANVNTLADQWNKQIVESMSQTYDQFSESGIMTGLKTIVSDGEEVPDMYDSDQDRLWGFDGTTPQDMMSRFGAYYDDRLSRANGEEIPIVRAFLDRLEKFLLEGKRDDEDDAHNDFAVYDRMSCPAADDLAISPCYSCCEGNAAFRPACCALTLADGGCGASDLATHCLKYSPFKDPSAPYPWVYAPGYDNPQNNKEKDENDPPDYEQFFSLRETLGRDDEHQNYYVNWETLNTTNPPQVLHNMNDPWNGIGGYHIEDTTGFYEDDWQKGIFPFFYKIADWGQDLRDLDITTGNHDEHCFWFDPRYEGYETYCQDAVLPEELDPFPDDEDKGLWLPDVPEEFGLLYNTNLYVDSINDNVGGNPPLASDKVYLNGYLVADNDECAEKAFSGDSTEEDPIGIWKRGADRYCSAQWPYNINCAKHGGADACVLKEISYTEEGEEDGEEDAEVAYQYECPECGDNGTNAVLWHDDVLDDVIYGSEDFIAWSQDKALDLGARTILSRFKEWYGDTNFPGAWTWIESPIGDSYISGSGGLMWQAREFLDGAALRVRDWIEGTHMNGYVSGADEDGNGGGETWCMPDPNDPLLQPDERASMIDENDEPIEGIAGVIACLEHNIDKDGEGKNNATRFRACMNACNDVMGIGTITSDDADLLIAADVACGRDNPATEENDPSYLPRSLVPGFNPSADYVAFDYDEEEGTWNETNPSCLDTEDGGYMENLNQSYRESRNQVVKFFQRRDFLADRLEEAGDVLTRLENARDKIDSFLTSEEVKALIDLRRRWDTLETGLPFYVIYGWQDGEDFKEPLWHIVRVDARLPQKCSITPGGEGTCGSGCMTSDPEFPQVKSYTKGFLDSLSCYNLVNTEGCVKFRVVRYDQPHETNSLLFPNGQPIWQFRFGRDVENPEDVEGLEEACPPMDKSSDAPAGMDNFYAGAFMVNSPKQGNEDDEKRAPFNYMSNPQRCWQKANALLRQGVKTETCAEYYYHGDNTAKKGGGMALKFVKCPPWGAND